MTSPIRVLLLEDDPADARLVEQMLRRIKTTSFEVTVARRLAEAVNLLAIGPIRFDVVLADLGLPDSAGMATLDALTGVAPSLAVVVLTGNDDDAVALEALKRGAQDYLVKGVGDAFILSRVVRYAIERKLGEQALKEARDTAEEAARAKSVFLAMMGHEIRTPLNGVLGMARLLLETPLDRRQRSFADTLVSSGELLLALVNDILDFSRLDAGGLTLELAPFDVKDTLEEVRLLLALRAQEKGLGFEVRFAPDIHATVRGDRLRLRQILFNLIGNAIKFTDFGGISVVVEPCQASGGPQILRFAVIDTGIGISAEVGETLFTEFWQGESGTARRFAGAGLGLSICRRLATLMGGDIAYFSRPGQGSTFQVELPLPESDEAPERCQDSRATIIRPQRILLVDDNVVNRDVAAGLLERRGHNVICASDGYEAVEQAVAGGFDLVLLDMRMPGIDGVETARAIRSLPAPAGSVPIYLLTANPVRDDEQRWQEAGIQGCLAKPFRIDDLGRILAGLGGGRRESPAPQPALVARADLFADRRDLGEDRMASLVDLFRSSSSADLDGIAAHLEAGRLSDLGSLAHRMASAASSLHLGPLAAACRSLENAAKAEDAAVPMLVAELGELWHRSMAAVAEAVREGDG